MDEIRLEQHFYGSAPVGLGSGRGFQTIAKSRGVGEASLFEPHCTYTRPEGRRSGAMPVNWGWFRLDESDDSSIVCIHSIGYAGSDEFGRPGNFLAHNLIATDEQLRAIDYDIPALIRWIRGPSNSKIRFSLKEGGDDGFAHRNAEIFELLGREKSSLGSAPTLDVPVAAIGKLREQLDDKLATETIPRLQSILGRDGVQALLNAYLVPFQERKPIRVLGCSDGTDECEAGLLVAEFLFGLLPYHCRRHFTFSTYDEPRSSASASRAG